MEKIINKRTMWFLETRGIYPKEMNGFRLNRSALDNIISMVSFVEEHQITGHIPIVISLDIIATFDSVLHHSVLEAFVAVGLGGRLYTWLSNYLEGRQHYMVTPEGLKSCYAVEKGVPQGQSLAL